ncbi:MAG: transcription-repair coupling factor [Gammaproteobacteria bacterium]|nr:transcription-repair coupling factor [Gammaproteobacteria bacterium]
MPQGLTSALRPRLPEAAVQVLHWNGLYGSSRAIALCTASACAGRPIVVLAADPHAAAELLDELSFYRGDANALPLLSFPSWEILPYDIFSPYQDIVSDRLSTLNQLAGLRRGLLVVPVATVMHRLLPGRHLRAHSLQLAVGQRLDMHGFRRGLADGGYRFVSQVLEHGDAALRGSLLDIFPMGAELPLRVDFLDDEIESIRSFDPETQRSLSTVERVDILPAREVDLTEAGIARFRAHWRSRFAGNPNHCPIYRDVSNGLAPAGIEYYLPLFYERTESLFDFLAGGCFIAFDEGAGAAIDAFWSDVLDRYEQGRHDIERPLLPPQELFHGAEEFRALLDPFPRIHISGLSAGTEDGSVRFAARAPTSLPVDSRAKEPFGVFMAYLRQFGGRVLIVAESPGRRETLLELLGKHDLRPALVPGWNDFLAGDQALALTVAPLDRGAVLDDPRIAVITEAQLFGDRAQQRRLRKARQHDVDAIVRDLAELTPGAPVVHLDHGVGRFLGLTTLTVGDVPGEFICLEYEGGDKLYVPVASLDLISRYTGMDPEHAPLHRLGGREWQRARVRAAARVHDVAAELLDLHSRRAARPGDSLGTDADAYGAFAQAFPFEETPGQAEAISNVIADLEVARPMDRLVCGDAGFGKTEVAMRAAFIAVHNNRQVALLVPTTLLAQQHFQNFRDRFADWPVRIEVLSRFIPRRRQEEILADLASGRVDIVIGTHRLLQKDVRFARLGLAILDEEHRFGVRQKERLKALRAEVDVLTLTATPIPRTLNLALSDLRDLSIISTPPARRLAVKTFVSEWNDALLKEAMLREISRGGQVYFLHNEVKNIAEQARRVEAMVPGARVHFAHGQMPERELERVMLDFYHRRFNILVCTTIIESGIDVPTANTIIINRADKFGLAQLYQLRGRVGRSHHRAYAYLVIPPRAALNADAVKRLEAVESLEELGIGFTLATHDLEIRGAGEILGEEQSGQIQEIGYSLYMELLERAVHTLKSGHQPDFSRPLDHGAEIDLHIAALIPEDYLPDVHARLILYKRISGAPDEAALTALREEIIDRFGPLPDQVMNLLDIARLKQWARLIGVRKIDLGPSGGRVHFDQQPRVDPARVLHLIQSDPKTFQFDGRDKLRIRKDGLDGAQRVKMLARLFEAIALRDAA